MRNLYLLFIAYCLLCALPARAQYDPMFTQYMFNEMYLNPAYAGSTKNLSVVMQHRSQWMGLDGAPVTQAFSAQAPFLDQKVGLGLTVLNESIGKTKRSLINGNYTYRFRMGKEGYLGLGLQAGLHMLTENYANVQTVMPNDKSFSTDSQILAPNSGFGLYYNTDKVYVGISVPRMFTNRITGNSAVNKMNLAGWHYYLASGYIFTGKHRMKYIPSVLIKMVQGAPVEADITFNMLYHDKFWGGLAYRSSDAASIMLGMYIIPQLRLVYSYDYTLTALQKFNSGSHEITLRYDFLIPKTKVISPRFF